MDEQEEATDSSQDKASKEANKNAATEGRPEAVSDDEKREAMEGQAGDSLSWIEGPDLGSPIEELPTLQWPDADADAAAGEATDQERSADGDKELESGPAPDELEEAIQWLEGLADEQGTPLDEMPTLISRGEADEEYRESEEVSEDLVTLGDTTPSAQIDSDPMAWLEQLAIDQSSPLEELPSVADRLLASEIVSQVSMDEATADNNLSSQPAELEAALQYLEELAAEQGISLDEVSFAEEKAVKSGEDELDTVDQLAKATATAALVRTAAQSIAADRDDQDDLLDQIPEDPDEALAWLAELADDESADEHDTPSAPARRQAEEGVTVPAEPGELAEEAAVVSAEPGKPGEDVVETKQKEGSVLKKATTMAAAAKMAKSRMDKDGEPEAGQEAADEVLDTDMLDGMPDDPDEAMLWMAGLAAAGEAEQAKKAEMATGEGGDEPASAAEEEPEQEAGQAFVKARHAVAAGDIATAVKSYRERLESSGGDPQLIEELETIVADQPDEPELLNVLGDAYMQNGQMQKALTAYRKGLA